jgi:hypothetical protein
MIRKKAKKMLPLPPSRSPILLDRFLFVDFNKMAKNNCNNHKITKNSWFIAKKQLKNATMPHGRIPYFIEFIKFWLCKKK